MYLADVAGDIIRDIEMPTQWRKMGIQVHGLPRKRKLDADWYFRWSQDETIDWTAVEHLLDEPKDTMIEFKVD